MNSFSVVGDVAVVVSDGSTFNEDIAIDSKFVAVIEVDWSA